MALGDLASKLKGKICDRKLDPGDVVRVDRGGESIPVTENTVGGRGKWAIFVEMRKSGAIVRELREDGTTGDKSTVEQVTHIDDIIRDVAVKQYKQRRLEEKFGKR